MAKVVGGRSAIAEKQISAKAHLNTIFSNDNIGTKYKNTEQWQKEI